MPDLVDTALTWIEGDPDPQTRQELQDLVDANDVAELADRVGDHLRFGTAGLRGVVGAGSNRMNRAVVIKATHGLAGWLRNTGDGPVVVAYDARADSAQFARDAADVLAAAGVAVLAIEEPIPTPLAAYVARVEAAAAAVVITASHNPAKYNGYKVYAANAAQIIPPADAQIADAIAGTGPATEIPRSGGGQAKPLQAVDVFDRYWGEVDANRPTHPTAALDIVYTPLHGVGGAFATKALAAAGHGNVEIVREQAEPDGEFPTVTHPNPEEPGTLDLALSLAGEVEADLVLANDPDADRLAVAVRSTRGLHEMLSGDQIGVLLGDYLLGHHSGSPTPLVVSSIVSSPMIGSIAAAHAARWEQTLTGFKWIINAALELEETEGLDLVLGYEEALGYAVGGVVRDKDGLSAAVAFADMAGELKSQGRTVLERLRQLYLQHGLWVKLQESYTLPAGGGAEATSAAMDQLKHPVGQLAGQEVTAQVDFSRAAEQRPGWLPATDLVLFDFDEGRALIRPSGTEPKLKIYVDLRFDVSQDDDISAIEHSGKEQASRVAGALAAAAGIG